MRSAATFTGGLVLALAATSGPARAVEAMGPVPGAITPPHRIVSLVPSLTETVCALGACDRLVGTDRYSDWPASVAALPKLGGLGDAQIERIVALHPDLVLAAPAERVVERLRALGVAVLVLRSDTRADMRGASDALATRLGTPAASAALWQRIGDDIQAAAAEVPVAARGRSVYLEVDPTPYAAGAASYLGETLAAIGLVDVVPAALGAFPRLNPEFVVRARPDIVMGQAAEVDAMPRRPGWSAIPGLAPHRSCRYDHAAFAVLVRPGPRLGTAAHIMARCVAGLRFGLAGPGRWARLP